MSLILTKAYKGCDILLWKIKIELADLKAKEIKLVHVITELKNKSYSWNCQGFNKPEFHASKTLSHRQRTNDIIIFYNIDDSVESTILSYGPGISCDTDLREEPEDIKVLLYKQDIHKTLGEQKISKCRLWSAVLLLIFNSSRRLHLKHKAKFCWLRN